MRGRYAPLKVRWRRHTSAVSIVDTFTRGMARAAKVKMSDVSAGDLAEQVERNGMWAYADSTPKLPVIHYWFDASVPPDELAFMLGHEVGHLSGKSVRSAWGEEERADTYGRATITVMRHLKR